LAACVPLLLSGCLAFVGPADRDEGVRDLVSARAQWNTIGLSDYDVVMRSQCFCVGGGERLRYSVRNNVVTSIVRMSTGDVDSLPTTTARSTPVEYAFDLVDRAMRENAAQLDVDYHDVWGFPRMLSVDFRVGVADDEITMHLEDFSPVTR
jgi:hypothetical protein